MKTKRTRLAPIGVEILMNQGSGHKIVAESGTTGVLRKEVLLLLIKLLLAPMLSLSLKHFTISAFYLFPRFVYQLQKTDSFFIAIFAPLCDQNADGDMQSRKIYTKQKKENSLLRLKLV